MELQACGRPKRSPDFDCPAASVMEFGDDEQGASKDGSDMSTSSASSYGCTCECAALLIEDDPAIPSVFEKPPLNWLPKNECCRPVDKDVSMLMATWGREVPMTCVTGSAVIWARISAASIWLFYIALPFLAYHVTACPPKGLYAQPPIWLWLVVIIPAILAALVIESKILSHVLAVQLQVTGSLTFLGGAIDFTHLPYWIWRSLVAILSIAGKCQIVTNALFLAKTWKTTECAGGKNVEAAWWGIEQHSIWGSVLILFPGMHPFLRWMNFQVVATFLWLTVTTEIAHVLFMTMPIGEKKDASEVDDDYHNVCSSLFVKKICGCIRDVCSSQPRFHVDYCLPESRDVSKNYVFEYETIFDCQMNHGSSVMILADAARNASVTFQDFMYARQRMQDWLVRRKGDYEFRYLHLAHQQLARGVHNFAFVGVLQSTLTLHLQITVMSIMHHALNVTHADGLTLAGVILNMVVLLAKLCGAFAIRKLYLGVCESVAINAQNEPPRPVVPTTAKHKYIWNEINRIYIHFRIFIVIYIVLNVYGIVKFVAYLVCPSHLFNAYGCIPVNEW